ncbi:Uncharacterised protein [Neisseria subflava]|uniref:Uncharacterized protein n=1 Tax=Neisseria subflava TaxID=28449 RepID=A0A9X9SM68_NEISU|nr:Uncharacterised protein [Neisseria subflava]
MLSDSLIYSAVTFIVKNLVCRKNKWPLFPIGKQEAKYNIYGYFIESFAIKILIF